MPATSSYTPTSYSLLYGILYGTKWAGSTLTFSFPSSAAVYGTPYGNGETSHNFEAFNATQQSATRAILEMYSSVAKLNFTEVTETSSTHADLRYGELDSPSTAWAYYPTTNILGGDIWMNNSKGAYDNPLVGTYGFFTLMHETGHALGLKHPHDLKGAFTSMSLDHDSIEYTVMSYRSYVGASLSGYTVGSSSYPQTLMMYDIAALQYIYGANYSTNSGNHDVSMERVDRADVDQRCGAGHASRQQDIHDDLGRRRHRHLRLLELFERCHRQSPAGRTGRTASSGQLASTWQRPLCARATSPMRCSTTTTPPR